MNGILLGCAATHSPAQVLASQPSSSPALLDVPHAVLCSEMGAHFSPCGRFLAACVACQGAEEQVVFELRVYSLEDGRFGEVVAAWLRHCG